ncbi:hypothetical protein PAPYR_12255 [Paratrimastix pyriformis]|uniref:Secreted protein n=1 Tax=Paratrimastix pyriformis TaxID=342808 RepID=A0ABQ8U900_9EUKA|nr:hypothetical protein PAPYR_12255 [Paratrimastix pyriformis]
MQYCGCSFVFDFFERLLVFTGASLQRCMREILIARAPMRRLFEVFDWFTTKTTRSGVAQSFTLSTKRFVLCELDTVILVRSFKAVPLLSPNSPLFSWKTCWSPLFRRTILQSLGLGSRSFWNALGLKMTERKLLRLEVLSRTRSGAPWALIGHERTTKYRRFAFRSFNWKSRKGYIFEPLWNSDVTRKASLPIALAQPAGFPSGFELRDGLLKARGTCLLGLGRVVLVTDHSDTVERSLCNRSTTTQPPSWETRRHGTRAPSGTDSLALEAMSEANSWGNYYQVVKSRGCTFPHCTVHAEGVHFL